MPPNAAKSEALRSRWIRAHTVTPAHVDYFRDGTGGQIAQGVSPIVSVEVQHAIFPGKPSQLSADLIVCLPICVGTHMEDRSELAPGDLVVCVAHRRITGHEVGGDEWLPLEEDRFELLPPREMPHFECEMPFLCVRLPRPCLVRVFSRKVDDRKPRMRVRLSAYLPVRLSPFDVHTLRIYVSQVLPDQLESVGAMEQRDRGLVTRCGLSDVFECAYGDKLNIAATGTGKRRATATEGQGSAEATLEELLEETAVAGAKAPAAAAAAGTGGALSEDDHTIDDATAEMEAETTTGGQCTTAAAGHSKVQKLGRGSVFWTGEVRWVDIPLDPALFSHAMHVELSVSAKVEDLRSIVEAEMKAEGKPTLARRGADGGAGAGAGAGARARAQRGTSFACSVAMKAFAPPAPPTALSLIERSSAAFTVAFQPPKQWGGSALKHHEVELRELATTQDGQIYYAREWEPVQTLPASLPTVVQIVRAHLAVTHQWKAEVRVRTWSVGCERPSDWSDVFVVSAPPPVAGGNRPPPIRVGGATTSPHGSQHASPQASPLGVRHQLKGSNAKGSNANGTSKGHHLTGQAAWEEQHSTARHVMSGAAVMRQQKWPALRAIIGSFFLELGVYGGCEGRVFELSAVDVEALIHQGEDPTLSSEWPLLSLAMLGTYAIRTLAEHSVVDRAKVSALANDAAMQVRLVVREATSSPTRNKSEIEGGRARAQKRPSAAFVARDATSVASYRWENGDRAPMMKALLGKLLDLHETLRQCQEGGVVAHQLTAAHYEKWLTERLREDWAEQLRRLKEHLATEIMNVVLYERARTRLYALYRPSTLEFTRALAAINLNKL